MLPWRISRIRIKGRKGVQLAQSLTIEEVERRVTELGPWFHNLSLLGVQTAPDHFLGNYPSAKWQNFQDAVPKDLAGMTVLDIGCNGGFYSIEMKRRGAGRVLGIDHDEQYLEQARFAAQVLDLDISFEQMSVYDVPKLRERFDVVLFMGVFYHLRYPLLALDLLRQHVAKDWLVFQSMLRGSRTRPDLEPIIRFGNGRFSISPVSPRCTSSKTITRRTRRTGGFRIDLVPKLFCGARDLK